MPTSLEKYGKEQQQKLLCDKVNMLEGEVSVLTSAFEHQQQKLEDTTEQICTPNKEEEAAKTETTAYLTSNKALLEPARRFYHMLQMRSAGNERAGTSTIDDAMTYVKAVKDKFLDNREKYDQFLQILKDFRAERTDTRGVIQRIEDLFKGHPDLILGFKAYLPKGYEISTTGEDEPSLKKPYEFEDLLTFLNKVQTQYQSDDHAFKSFLEVLSDSTVEGNSTTEIYDEVAKLFHQHPNLLKEFKEFL